MTILEAFQVTIGGAIALGYGVGIAFVTLIVLVGKGR